MRSKHQNDEGTSRYKGADKASRSLPVPSSPLQDGRAVRCLPGEGQKVYALPSCPETDATVSKLRAWHRKRRFAMKQQGKLDRALESYVRRQMTDWRPDMVDEDRKAANARVASLIEAARKGKPEAEPIADDVAANDGARAYFDTTREAAEGPMETLAKGLPVYPWVKGVRGFGELSLATIVGEAGNLSNYATKSKLWKRMGVAVFDGIRQGGLKKGAAAEEWIAHGYNRERRSMLWVIGDSIIKQQVRKVKDADGKDTGERKSIGPYGAVYLARKAYELARDPEIKPIAAHRRAQRYMEKRLLRDLWQAWRRAGYAVSERISSVMPDADSFPEAA
jgi:hypothetical protein